MNVKGFISLIISIVSLIFFDIAMTDRYSDHTHPKYSENGDNSVWLFVCNFVVYRNGLGHEIYYNEQTIVVMIMFFLLIMLISYVSLSLIERWITKHIHHQEHRKLRPNVDKGRMAEPDEKTFFIK